MFSTLRLPRALAGLCLLVMLGLALAPMAWAQTAKDGGRAEARRLLRAGNAAYERGNFAAALDKFEQAQNTYPSARIQFNIGQALRELGRPVEATVAFETFLDKADRITTKERKEATAAIEALDPQVARITVVTTLPEVAVTVGGIDRGKTPLSRPVVVAPGTHEITLGRPGYRPVRESVTVAGGESRRVNIELKPDEPPPRVAEVVPPLEPPVPLATPAPDNAPPVAAVPAMPDLGVSGREAPPPSRPQRVVGASLVVASAVFAIAGGVFLASSWSRYHSAQDHGCGGSCDDVADQVDNRALWSKLFFGAAAAAGVGGGILLLTAPPPASSGQATTRGAMLVGRHTF
jgi:hypothetical protein